MLRYLALGQRDFGTHPMVLSRRVDWEFYAVLRGRCAPVFFEDARVPLSTLTLWVLPPENLHGWIGARGRPCRIAAFQFAFLPQVLCDLARQHGILAVSITAKQAREIEGYARELQPHFDRPTSLSELHSNRTMLQLSLMALTAIPSDRVHPFHKQAQEKVDEALRWYSARLPENPSVKMIAAAQFVSPGHLRRLFWTVRRQRPKQLLRRIQLERVVERMSRSSDNLEQIAAECGFSTASELCRAFKARFKVPPSVWRKNMLPLYRAPRATRGEAAKVRPNSPVQRKLGKYVRLTAESDTKKR